MSRASCSRTSARARSQLWVYDKSTGESFQTNIRNIAGERNFYEAEIGGRVLSLEEGLGELEAKAAAIIARIIEARSIGGLSEDDRILLAVFVAIQIKRVPNSRERVLALGAALKKVLGERGFDPAFLEGYPEMTRDDAKVVSLMSLTEPDQYAEHILDKSWLLFETDPTTPFYISDNPVAMQNLVESRGPGRGNLGLGVLGIEIYLPISSTLTLGFYCRSHEQLIRQGVEKYRTAVIGDPDLPIGGFGPLLDWMRAFRKGTPLASVTENVLNHNSLQVRQAERYVFSGLPDFSLVEDMIANEPRYRVGPRPQIL